MVSSVKGLEGRNCLDSQSPFGTVQKTDSTQRPSTGEHTSSAVTGILSAENPEISKFLKNMSVDHLLKNSDQKNIPLNIDYLWGKIFVGNGWGKGLSIINTIRKIDVYPMLKFCASNNFLTVNKLKEILIAIEMPCKEKYDSLKMQRRYNLTDGRIIALVQGWVSPKHIQELYEKGEGYLHCLCDTEEGLTALHEKLITPEQVIKMPSCGYLKYLCSTEGLVALRKNLITPEQAIEMPRCGYLQHLCSKEGVEALNGELINLEQAKSMPSGEHLSVLCSARGLTALRKNWMTAERARLLPLVFVKFLLSEEGEKHLCDIPFSEIRKMKHLAMLGKRYDEISRDKKAS